MGLDESKSTHNNGSGGCWILPGAIVLLSLLVMLSGEAGRLLLRFDRVWISEGEAWRWLSGHLTHLGWSHFALNGAGLVLVWYLVGGRYTTRVWLANMGITVVVIDIGFWVFSPALHWYVGLSGLLHGLLAAGILARQRRLEIETVVLAGLLFAKLIWEQIGGPMPGSEASSGGPVIVDAHLYGAIGGVLAALLVRIRVLSRTSI